MHPEDHDAIKREKLEALKREVDGLKTALGTPTLIGKAIGLIIEREGVNETEAFEMLKTMSQHTNVRLRDMAARLAEEAQPAGRQEPDAPSPQVLARQRTDLFQQPLDFGSRLDAPLPVIDGPVHSLRPDHG
jgi:hypothetical protein